MQALLKSYQSTASRSVKQLLTHMSLEDGTMITAAEALKLHEESGEEVRKFLACIETSIRQAAKSGKRSVEVYSDAQQEYIPLEATDLRNKVCEELRKLGFVASFRYYGESYVPRSMEDEDNAQKIRNFGYCIGW
jgi:hypothetical protein